MRRLLLALALLPAPPALAAYCNPYPLYGGPTGSGLAYAPVRTYYVCDLMVPATGESGDLAFRLDTNAIYVWDGGSWVLQSNAASSDATFITQTAEASLNNEQALGTLAGDGLLYNTVSPPGTGTLSIYGGDGCASGYVTGIGALGTVTCNTVDFSSALETSPNQGTTTTVLHGNAAGQPSFGGIRRDSGDSAWECVMVPRKVFTAGVSNSTTSFADITGLTWSIAASTNYGFACNLFVTTAAGTTAVELSVNGPASPTSLRYAVTVPTSATAVHMSSQTAYDTVTTAGTGNVGVLPATLVGHIENGANAGTLAIRVRSEVSTSAVTVGRGSFCTLF